MLKNDKNPNDINLILPKKFFDYRPECNRRLYFLAGPIRGGGDWQSAAIKILAEKDKNCYIVCPCRYDSSHKLYPHALNIDDKQDNGRFSSQTIWERHYLELASFYGAIIFWLPLESKEAPRPKKDGPYARDTLGEIARWSVRSAFKLGCKISEEPRKNRVNVVIGIEQGFSGLEVIKKNLQADYGHPFKIADSLPELINLAVTIDKK